MKEAEPTNVNNLFSNAKLTVPSYQRSYSWTEEQVKEFLDDIEYICREERDAEEHYFGTVVLEFTGEEKWAGSTVDTYDIIDGQQRLVTVTIFFRALINEMERVVEEAESRNIVENGNISELSGTIQNYKQTFIARGRNQPLEPESLAEDAYRRLIVRDENINEIDCLPARNVKNAKSEIQKRIQCKNLSEKSDQELQQLAGELTTKGLAVSSRFPLTKNVVSDGQEAARMFKVINDRGKDLSLAEKIKSHLSYCCSINEGLEPVEVSRKINSAVENITQHKSTSASTAVDTFFRRHWSIYSGSYRTKGNQTIYESIQSAKHAHPEYEGVTEWIESYIKSVEKYSQTYVKLREPSIIVKELSEDNSISEKARFLHDKLYMSFGVHRAMDAFLISAAKNYGTTSTTFLELLYLSECFVVRRHSISSNTISTLQRELTELAHNLAWLNKDESSEAILGKATEFDTDADIAGKARTLLKQEVRDTASKAYIQELVKEQDVFDGNYREGWGGFRRPRSIRYVLYEYEKSLRDDSDTGLSQLPLFSEVNASYEIEHIEPQNSDNPEFEKLKDQIGNLALWKPKDNKKASDNKFSEKNDSYENSGMLMLAKLIKENDTWETENITERSEELAEFVINRWSVDNAGLIARRVAQD